LNSLLSPRRLKHKYARISSAPNHNARNSRRYTINKQYINV
jgi:hypothetical protein